jgi:hypothetical protein
MKNIIIKSDDKSGFLRTEAVAKAIEFENYEMNKRKEGWRNGIVLIKESNGLSFWSFFIYHTKTAIIVDIRFENR